jgi:hypothetical protein
MLWPTVSRRPSSGDTYSVGHQSADTISVSLITYHLKTETETGLRDGVLNERQKDSERESFFKYYFFPPCNPSLFAICTSKFSQIV